MATNKYYCSTTMKNVHLELLKKYLELYKRDLTDKNAIQIAKVKLEMFQAKFPKLLYCNNYTAGLVQLEKWSDLVTELKLNGYKFLCLKIDKRIILPEEAHVDIINQAHTGIKTFKGFTKFAHNGYKRTLSLLKQKFAVGLFEFGIKKSTIKSYISDCQKCRKQKPLVLSSSSNETKDQEEIIQDTDQLKTERKPSPNNLSAEIEIPFDHFKNKLITQVWSDDDSEDSIWYNRKGLANEKNLYKKLVGIVTEIGLETHLAVDGNENAKENLLLKICCAEQIISRLKSQYQDMSVQDYCSPYALGSQLDAFKKCYLEIKRLDTFLYDVNLLLNTPHITTAVARQVWLKLINEFMSLFPSQVHTSEPKSINFDEPITLNEYDIEPIRKFLCGNSSFERDGDNSIDKK